jgi:hypothetical protein
MYAPLARRDVGKQGYIDKTGALAIKPQFDYTHDFSEGLAAVRIHREDGYDDTKNDFGFIDKTGKWVIKPQFHDAGDFHEGLAVVLLNDKFGYVDKLGKIVITPRFALPAVLTDFHEGLARVPVSGQGDANYIDKTGRLVIQISKAASGDFCDGLAPVSTEYTFVQQLGWLPCKWGFLDHTGKFVIEPQFLRVEKFSEGLSMVARGKIGDAKGEFAFIDKSGKVIIKSDLPLTNSGSFSEGLAPVQVNRKWGFIDKTGKLVVKPQFDEVYGFSEGLACVVLRDE